MRRALMWLALLAGLAPALAQAPAPKRASPGAPPAPPAATAPPPALPPALQAYNHDFDRLAAIMGSLAFLRDLCGHGDGASWRARMAELLDAEGSTPERRDALAGAFNQNFRGLQITYRRCTPAARELSRRLTREGAALSRTIASRYGT